MSKKSTPTTEKIPYISEQLQSLAVPIDLVFPDPQNARKHDKRNRDGVRALLEEYGQLIPIVVDRATNIIIKGNCTHGETKALGRKFIAVVFQDFKPGQAVAFGLDDNRIGELGSWEYQIAAEHIRTLQEFEDAPLYAWSEAEIEPLLQADWTPPAPSDDSALHALVAGAKEHAGSTPADSGHGDQQRPPAEHDAGKAKPIQVTPAQRETIDRAVDHVRLINDDQAMSEGRCIELACADYLAGA
jgi:hypothetical protein